MLTRCGVGAGKYIKGEKPWKNVENVQIAMPCATQNEVDESDVEALIKAGCKVITEVCCPVVYPFSAASGGSFYSI